jgi:hypothetical protein
MTVSTKVIEMIVTRTDLSYVQIQYGKRLQIAPNFQSLPYCQKNHSAAFIKSHNLLVVWEDDPQKLLTRAQGIQDALVKMIWGDEIARVNDKAIVKSIGVEVADPDEFLSEVEHSLEPPRRLRLWQTCYTSIAITMLTVAIGSGWRQVVIQQYHEPNLLRLLFAVAIPAQAWLSLVILTTFDNNQIALTYPVLLPGCRRKYRTNIRIPDTCANKQQILLRQAPQAPSLR